MCVLTYPGIMYSDSYTRINLTRNLGLSLHAFFAGDAKLKTVSSWITIVPSFLILLSQKMTGSVALYTFAQCFLLFLTSYAFGTAITGRGHRRWNAVWITLSPVLWAYGIYYEAGVGCAAAIMCILLLVWKWDGLTGRFDRALTAILLAVASFLCFGYRANAFTILPALLLIIVLREKKALGRMALAASVLLGFVFTALVPRLMNIDTMASYAGGLVWETVSVIQTMEEDKRQDYTDYLDDVFGEGTTAEALRRNTYLEDTSSINDIWWGYPFASAVVSDTENTKVVLNRYFGLMLREPRTYLKVKWEFISRTLGISRPLEMLVYDYNTEGRMGQYGFNDSLQRQNAVNLFLAYMDYMKVFRMPWLLFLTAFLLILIWRFKFYGRKEPVNLYEAAFGVACFYYGAYMLDTQSFEFRYFFPSWLLLVMIVISVTGDMLLGDSGRRKTVFAVFSLMALVCAAGTYGTYTRDGDEALRNCAKQGTLVYEDEKHHVYFRDGKLYFIADIGADMEYPYFLYFYSVDGDRLDKDFSFRDSELATSFWKADIAVEDIMADQPIGAVRFGQYYGETELWAAEQIPVLNFMSCPETLYVSEHSGDGWTRGYSDAENCFLTSEIGVYHYLLIGKTIEDGEGNVYRITDVAEDEGYLRVYTDAAVRNTDARVFQVTEEGVF